MGLLDSLFSPGDAYKDAEKQSQKYYMDAQGRLQPLIDQGQAQYSRLNNQANLLNDPAKLESDWSSGYTTSPYATQMMDKSKESGLGAASSMGLLGSSAALGNIQQSAGDIVNSDRQNYMQDLMQKYLQSIGIGQSIYGTGASAAGQYSQNAMGEGNTMGALSYGEQNAPGSMLGNLLGKGLNLGVNYATGGLAGVGKAMGTI